MTTLLWDIGLVNNEHGDLRVERMEADMYVFLQEYVKSIKSAIDGITTESPSMGFRKHSKTSLAYLSFLTKEVDLTFYLSGVEGEYELEVDLINQDGSFIHGGDILMLIGNSDCLKRELNEAFHDIVSIVRNRIH